MQGIKSYGATSSMYKIDDESEKPCERNTRVNEYMSTFNEAPRLAEWPQWQAAVNKELSKMDNTWSGMSDLANQIRGRLKLDGYSLKISTVKQAYHQHTKLDGLPRGIHK